MRLTAHQVQIIKDTVTRVVRAPCQIWLFGSRVQDMLRGGDIDLLVETKAELPNRADMICRLYGALIYALGDRKIDILLKDAKTKETPVFSNAKRRGVML